MSLLQWTGKVSRAAHAFPGGYFISLVLKKLFKPLYPKNQDFVAFQFQGIRFNVELHTDLGQKLFWRGAHSWPPIFTLINYIKPGFTCIDLGANQGEYTLWMSKLTGSQGEVHSFEPAPKMIAQLKKNLQANQYFSKNVQVHEYGLSDEDCFVDLYLPEEGLQVANEGAASVFKSSEKDEFIARIELKKSGDTIRKVISKKVDFMKIDIEGSEMKALKGMEEVLREDKPIILIEINKKALNNAGSSPLEVARFLENLGYNFFFIEQRGKLSKVLLEQFESFDDENILAFCQK